jgi:flagellar biosynthesis protein FliQ
MTSSALLELVNNTLFLMGIMSAPVLLISLVLGVAIGIVQVVTSIQEQSLAFVPKLLATLLILALTMPWMLSTMLTYSRQIFTRMEQIG